MQQGVKEGLVASPREWPGIHSAKIGESGTLEGTWFDRTQEYWAKQRGEEVPPRRFATPETVTITPLPAWQTLDPETRSAPRPTPLFHAATKAVRDALRQAYRPFLAAYRSAAERLRAGRCTRLLGVSVCLGCSS